MADAKLTALPAASALDAADLFYVSQSAASRKATGTQLLALVGTTYVPLAGGTMTGALTIASGTLTASAPALSITQTWTTGATFTARVMNITDTSSNSASLFEDYQIAGVSKVSIRKDGYISSTGLISSGEVYISAAGTLNFNGSSFVYREASGVLGQIGGATAQAYHIYGTADGYPGANYQRMVLSANGTTGVTIAAEGLGTPTANQDITLTPGGTGRLNLGANAYVDSYGLLAINSTLLCVNAWLGANSSVDYYNTGFASSSSAFFAWTDGARSGTIDTAFKRNAAGVVEVNNGTAGTWRDLKLRNLLNTEYHQMTEMTAPSAPAANSVRIYAEDNGAGKTRLMALFATGSAVQLGIEP